MTNGFGLGGCRWRWLLLAALPTTVGCAETTDRPADPNAAAAGGAGASAPHTVDEFAQRFASRYCQSIAPCCSRQGFAATDCQSTLQEQVRARLQLSASNPKIRFNFDAAAVCIEAYAMALSRCTDPAAFARTDSACEALLEGTVALGGECGQSTECARSAGPVNCTTGVCVLDQRSVSLFDAPHRLLGETCAGTCNGTLRSASCGGPANGADPALGACWIQDGFVCSSGVCVRAPKAGEACVSSYCEAPAHCMAGVCAADSSNGPCTQDDQCLTPTICESTLKICSPLKANGEACDQSDQCLGGQCYQDRCRTWTVAREESCLGLLDD